MDDFCRKLLYNTYIKSVIDWEVRAVHRLFTGDEECMK